VAPGALDAEGVEAVSEAEAAIRALYAQAVAGTGVPRWGYFGREDVGVLLAEIDRLRSPEGQPGER
jgi:hypothetical protein